MRTSQFSVGTVFIQDLWDMICLPACSSLFPNNLSERQRQKDRHRDTERVTFSKWSGARQIGICNIFSNSPSNILSPLCDYTNAHSHNGQDRFKRNTTPTEVIVHCQGPRPHIHTFSVLTYCAQTHTHLTQLNTVLLTQSLSNKISHDKKANDAEYAAVNNYLVSIPEGNTAPKIAHTHSNVTLLSHKCLWCSRLKENYVQDISSGLCTVTWWKSSISKTTDYIQAMSFLTPHSSLILWGLRFQSDRCFHLASVPMVWTHTRRDTEKITIPVYKMPLRHVTCTCMQT